MSKKTLLIMLTVGALFSMSVSGCGKASEKDEVVENKLNVSAITVSSGNIETQGEFVGSLAYAKEVSVFPKLSGEVTSTFFKEGDYVEEGQLLFTLDDTAYQMSLRNAKAAYASAEAGVDQQVGALGLNRDTAENAYLNAQDGVEQVQHNYAYFEQQIGYLQSDIAIAKENREDMKDDLKSAKKKLKKARADLKDTTSDVETEAIKNRINSLKTSVATYESGIDSLDIQINTYQSNIVSLEMQRDNACYSYNQAVRGTDLAEESLEYFDEHTAPDTIKSAGATLEQVQVGIDTAKLQIEYTQVKAPVSGIIKEKKVDEFDMVAAGAPAYVITSEAGIEAKFSVPESTCAMFTIGQPVTVERCGKEYEGTITELPTQVNANTGLFEVKATVPAAAGLNSGTSVTVKTRTSHVENVTSVPVDCVYFSGGKSYVYAVENGVVRQIFVETGLYDDENMQILEGLDEGMKVITTWSSDLRDGLEVEVDNA